MRGVKRKRRKEEIKRVTHIMRDLVFPSGPYPVHEVRQILRMRDRDVE
jgi:hypothetical protein